jgi:hypothetical protein
VTASLGGKEINVRKEQRKRINWKGFEGDEMNILLICTIFTLVLHNELQYLYFSPNIVA